MPIAFPEFKTLNLAQVEAQATGVATAQFKLGEAIDQKARSKTLSDIAQSSNVKDPNTGEISFDRAGHIQKLREGGFTQEANKAEQSFQESRARGLENTQRVLGMTAQLFQGVTDQKSYDLAVARSYKTKLAKPDSLPAKYDPAFVKRIVDNSLALQKFGLEQTKQKETVRHHRATERAARIKARTKADKPSSGLKRQRELEAQGVPKDIARAVGFNTVKVLKDQFTQDATLIDVTTGRTLGRIEDGVFKQETTFATPTDSAGGGIPAADIKPNEKTATNAEGERAVLRDGEWQTIAP